MGQPGEGDVMKLFFDESGRPNHGPIPK